MRTTEPAYCCARRCARTPLAGLGSKLAICASSHNTLFAADHSSPTRCGALCRSRPSAGSDLDRSRVSLGAFAALKGAGAREGINLRNRVQVAPSSEQDCTGK